MRIDVGPTGATPVELSEPNVQRTETSAGSVLWTSDPDESMPRIAVWDDGRHSSRLEVLDGAEPGAWTEEDLVALVEAFATAPENEATPPPSG